MDRPAIFPSRDRCYALPMLLAACLVFSTPCAANAAPSLRIATFNLSLYGQTGGEILARLQSKTDPQAQHLAEIIQRVRPDVILLNEIDHDPDGAVLKAFCDNYLTVPQHASQSPAGPAEAIQYPYRYTAAVNTGRHSGFDLGRNGTIDATPGSDAYGADAWGYGRYAGQYAMAILSRYPIDEAKIRTFQNFHWRDMPDAQLPDDPATPEPHDWYSAAALEQFPLSSKSHWDVPIVVNGRTIHLLASHPTPPTFDGPEDRNGKRNHDEIRFWVDYIGPAEQGAYIVDDHGAKGGLAAPQSEQARPAPGASFVILGDLNGDPLDGDGPAGIAALLAAPQLLKYSPPASLGAVEQAKLQGGTNARHRGDPAHDTCDPADDPGPGNLHIDYALPSADLKVTASGVFWPTADDPLFPLVGTHPFPSSDHRLVWVDLEL
ncbi:endonuclease/exonuclease/phosphatase family protein [Lacipirellula parvula]|uniref:Succinyl-CoA synthetase alpha subunit n=1 Tax=Lacipirellula parvula TaxID=2650471 RepID=A0A5K7X2V3_9BACT|nr:endonuclease/exonuclease/phosphatase family protein [Lacipirellula parvula]BBO30984.1 succinyl-CoA synthetase alpha subunit [Lacipirellula parvula]